MDDAPHPTEKDPSAVDKAIRKWSAAAAAAVLQPLSVVDAFFIGPIHHRMVQDIGCIYGCPDNESARHRIFKALRGSLVKVYAAIVGAN